MLYLCLQNFRKRSGDHHVLRERGPEIKDCEWSTSIAHVQLIQLGADTT